VGRDYAVWATITVKQKMRPKSQPNRGPHHTGMSGPHPMESPAHSDRNTHPDHPATPSGLSYKTRVSQLAEAIAKWHEENTPKGPSPSSDAYHSYWTKKMPEFHDDLGKQVLVLMQEMRKCPYLEVKTIYWREKPRVTLPAMLLLQVRDLRALKDLLPEQDNQLPCVQSP
jgi:hypothetical protein